MIDFSVESNKQQEYPGVLIVFEGNDGAGKTTQAKRLVYSLQLAGEDAIYVRTPGGTDLGESLRNMLLDPELHISSLAEMFLFSAQLSQCITEVILPALITGKTVICDRLIFSFMAYQGAGRQMDEYALHAIQLKALQGVWPDFGFLLYNAPKKETDGTRMEVESEEFKNRVSSYYNSLPENETVTSFMKKIEVTPEEEKIGALILCTTMRKIGSLRKEGDLCNQ